MKNVIIIVITRLLLPDIPYKIIKISAQIKDKY